MQLFVLQELYLLSPHVPPWHVAGQLYFTFTLLINLATYLSTYIPVELSSYLSVNLSSYLAVYLPSYLPA
jgi:hypothetical protein